LGGILDQGQLVFLGNAIQLVHIRAVSVEMDGMMVLRREHFTLSRASTAAGRCSVFPDRYPQTPAGPRRAEWSCGGKKAERRGDHIMAGVDAGGCQSQPQSVRARGAAYGIFRPAQGREFPLENADFITENIALRIADAINGR